MRFEDIKVPPLAQYFEKNPHISYEEGGHEIYHVRKDNEKRLVLVVNEEWEFEIDYIYHPKNNYLITIVPSSNDTRVKYRINDSFTVKIFENRLIGTF
jgi:hypothetical protein